MPHRVCVVGAGIGSEHASAYANLPESFAVHSICDLDEERGKGLAEKHKAHYVRDIEQALADPAIDIIDICLPPHLHFSTCANALDAGKKVICEKPLVTSLKEADRLADKVKQTNGFLSPVFQYRFGQGTAQLRALIEAGLAGKCYAGTVETHWNRPASYYDVDWRGTWTTEGGGALLGHAIHIHDLLMSIIGPVDTLFADVATRVNEIEVEDCAALSIRMTNGALITSSVTLGSAEDKSRIKLMFEGFTIESDHAPYAPAAKPWHFQAREPTSQDEVDAVLAQVPQVSNGYVGMFQAVANALNGRGGQEVSFEDGRRSLEFVTAAYASARSGDPITLPIGSEHPLYDGWLPDSV